MGFLEIVVTVCALSNPNLCEDQRIILDASMSLERCAMQAQPTLAQWASRAPGLGRNPAVRGRMTTSRPRSIASNRTSGLVGSAEAKARIADARRGIADKLHANH